jgi:hypothetical protein
MPSQKPLHSTIGTTGGPADNAAPAGLSPSKPSRAPSKTPVTASKDPVAGLPTKISGYQRTFHMSPVETKDGLVRIPTNNFHILSIDGGGARGMIPAVILKEMERRSGKRVSQLFDRICGTSTGAILACVLSAPQSAGSSTPMFHAREIVELYRTLGAEIFSRGSFDETVLQPMDALLGRSISWIATHAQQALDTAHDVWQRLNKPLHDVHKLAYVLHGYLATSR